MDVYKKEYTVNSPQETMTLGKHIGNAIIHAGSIICLYGDLGSGKTLLTKGIAKGIGMDEKDVKSPSYTLINYYTGRFDMYHIDLYRIGDPVGELEDMGYRDIFYGNGITVIEWADKVEEILPEERLDIAFAYTGDDTRDISIIGRGKVYETIVRTVENQYV